MVAFPRAGGDPDDRVDFDHTDGYILTVTRGISHAPRITLPEDDETMSSK